MQLPMDVAVADTHDNIDIGAACDRGEPYRLTPPLGWSSAQHAVPDCITGTRAMPHRPSRHAQCLGELSHHRTTQMLHNLMSKQMTAQPRASRQKKQHADQSLPLEQRRAYATWRMSSCRAETTDMLRTLLDKFRRPIRHPRHAHEKSRHGVVEMGWAAIGRMRVASSGGSLSKAGQRGARSRKGCRGRNRPRRAQTWHDTRCRARCLMRREPDSVAPGGSGFRY